MQETFIETLPADWASALVNNDWSGLSFYQPEEAEKAKKWLSESGMNVVSCSETPYIGKINGITTECLDYYCVKK